jgi:hypothetical protein
MLTYHHYLLSGFAAVSFATAVCLSVSVTSPNLAVQKLAPQRLTVQGEPVQNVSIQNDSVQNGPAKRVFREVLEVAYRGSGRINDEPVNSKSIGRLAAHSSSLAHRGSGRVHPQFL